MKTTQINNKHYQECDVVMVSTKIKPYFLELWGKWLFNTSDGIYSDREPKAIGQHLYILSSEEIKKNNWKLCLNDNLISQYLSKKSIESDSKCENCKKIIATTDSSLETVTSGVIKTEKGHYGFTTLKPFEIPQSFIEYFINEYNKGNVISKVLVEVENKSVEQLNDMYGINHWRNQQIKLNQNNEISILTKSKQETVEDKIKTLISEWQQRQVNYENLARTAKDEHTDKKFTYKAVATRDCWKELLKLIEDEQKQETVEEFIERHGITKQTLIDVYEEYVKNALIEFNSQRMYSKKEVINLLNRAVDIGYNYCRGGGNVKSRKSIDNWIEKTLE